MDHYARYFKYLNTTPPHLLETAWNAVAVARVIEDDKLVQGKVHPITGHEDPEGK
jgi:hypothetical protein